MPTLIDLSIPVRHGDGRLGLEVSFSTPYSYESCGWQGSSFSMFAHLFESRGRSDHCIFRSRAPTMTNCLLGSELLEPRGSLLVVCRRTKRRTGRAAVNDDLTPGQIARLVRCQEQY